MSLANKFNLKTAVEEIKEDLVTDTPPVVEKSTEVANEGDTVDMLEASTTIPVEENVDPTINPEENLEHVPDDTEEMEFMTSEVNKGFEAIVDLTRVASLLARNENSNISTEQYSDLALIAIKNIDTSLGINKAFENEETNSSSLTERIKKVFLAIKNIITKIFNFIKKIFEKFTKNLSDKTIKVKDLIESISDKTLVSKTVVLDDPTPFIGYRNIDFSTLNKVDTESLTGNFIKLFEFLKKTQKLLYTTLSDGSLETGEEFINKDNFANEYNQYCSEAYNSLKGFKSEKDGNNDTKQKLTKISYNYSVSYSEPKSKDDTLFSKLSDLGIVLNGGENNRTTSIKTLTADQCLNLIDVEKIQKIENLVTEMNDFVENKIIEFLFSKINSLQEMVSDSIKSYRDGNISDEDRKTAVDNLNAIRDVFNTISNTVGLVPTKLAKVLSNQIDCSMWIVKFSLENSN